MTFWNILDTLLLKPLQLLFEVIYTLANRVITNPGAAIIVLSLLMNLLVLPLYKRADALQEEEKNIEQKLRRGVQHIKKTFSGDEKMMILQTYYRQNHYKPTYVLRGAISLLLEIPFFIAAYRFLSNLQLLQGASFGPIQDLGAPDGLLHIFGLTVNLLPIVMTAVNLVSCVIFTKGSPLKTKLQLYAMAIFFLVFLYDSPSGLVFYWTLNNVFSLVKTIFYKLKHSKKILLTTAALVGIASIVYALFFQSMPTLRRTAFFIACGLALQLPLIYAIVNARLGLDTKLSAQTGNKKIFLTGALLLAVLIGFLIPSAVIRSSPQEFVDLTLYRNPIWYLVSGFCLAFGAFVIWLGVFYWLAKPSARAIFDRAVWLLCGVCIVNYMFFGKNLGTLSFGLAYNSGALVFSRTEQLINLAVLCAVCAVLLLFFRFFKKYAAQALAVVLIAIIGMSAFNTVSIGREIRELRSQPIDTTDTEQLFSLSKEGKNVVVFMLDRGFNEFIPYIFNEKPELKEQFTGFTYYPDTLSFGGATNFGSPALFGGYDYTPIEMNRRSNLPLAKKQNEALLLMPLLFDRNGYDVTVCDPSYANYKWHSDTSIYDPYPGISAHVTKGRYSNTATKALQIKANDRNFFCYSLMKTLPLCTQGVLYDRGNYLEQEGSEAERSGYLRQTVYSNYTATGVYSTFMDAYSVLVNLPGMTGISDGAENTFLMMVNETPHEITLLQEPDYVPQYNVDNRDYEKSHADRFTLDGKTLAMDTLKQIEHYQVNVAALTQIGAWLDYLRENGVYDNTRIILVADHGKDIYSLKEMCLEDGTDLERFWPLLMVKDFGSKEFTVSNEFMTNGDVPTLAMQGLIGNPVNPFTGNAINSDTKQGTLYVIDSQIWNTNENNGNAFLPARWFAVKDSMLDPNNWKLVAEDATLPPEE